MIQINIDMPRRCEECPLCVDYDCIIHERITGEYYEGLNEQYAHCPLIMPSAQPEQSDTSEFWRKRADFYSDMCMNLIEEMGRGVKIKSVKISENGIEFIKEQPPSQPKTEERMEKSAQNVPNGDLISRKGAIDAFWQLDVEIRPSAIDAITNMLKSLPSAQSEIIHCRDCRYSTDFYQDGCCYCKRPSEEMRYIEEGYGFYCAGAERQKE